MASHHLSRGIIRILIRILILSRLFVYLTINTNQKACLYELFGYNTVLKSGDIHKKRLKCHDDYPYYSCYNAYINNGGESYG